MSTIQLVREHLNPDLAVRGVLLTMFDGRTKLALDVRAEVRRHLEGAVLEAIIPRNVSLSEAPGYGLPIALYRPGSAGAKAYEAAAEEWRARSPGAAREGEGSPAHPTAQARDVASDDVAGPDLPADRARQERDDRSLGRDLADRSAEMRLGVAS